jgi:hypothetical protein
MPLTLRVGCSRKVGQPGYSSLGASCALDVELDAGLVERDPEALRAQIRTAFAACRAAVAEELARQADDVGAGPPVGPEPIRPPSAHPVPGRNGAEEGHLNGNHPARGGRPASEKQIKAIRAIARRNGADLESILRRGFRVDRLDDLSVAEASKLIDELKADAAV